MVRKVKTIYNHWAKPLGMPFVCIIYIELLRVLFSINRESDVVHSSSML